MKALILSLALGLAAAPAALAQIPMAVGNTAIVGAQMNQQTGAFNQASNQVGVTQRGFAFGGWEPALPAAAEPTLHTLFGDGPLVNNNVAVGTQVNIQNGANNSAANVLSVGQSAGAGGGFGGLVNNNVSAGAQVNLQNGFGNQAINAIGVSQAGHAGGFLVPLN